jgi:hypothetical protein
MLKYFLIPISLFILTSCTNKQVENERLKVTKAIALDSFSIHHHVTKQEELADLIFLNDSTLLGFNGFNTINRYAKKGVKFIFQNAIDLVPSINETCFLYKHRYQWEYFRFYRNTIYNYDSTFRLKDSIKINYDTKYLKKDFFLSFGAELPLIQLGDTFISNYTHIDVTNFYNTYKEDAYMEFVIKNKQISTTKTYAKKPVNLKYYDVSFISSHCIAGNKLYKIYCGIDTLYIIDRITGLESKKPIRNKDYQLPEKTKLEKIDNAGYITKHSLSTFQYTAIFYNENSGHFIVFYSPPASAKEDKAITYKDKALKAIVLDNNLDILNYWDFVDNYLGAYCFYQIKNKGLAMPLENNTSTNEKTTFYIYNY